MPTANNMMFISPETASAPREAGHVSAGKANGQPPAPGAWLAVLENTSSAPGESSVWKNPSASLQSALGAFALDTDGLEKGEQRSAIHGEKPLSAQNRVSGIKQDHPRPPSCSGNPELSAPDQAIPETSEAKTAVALDKTGISVFATPGASPAGPPTRLDNPILSEAAHEHGGPENREAGACDVHGASDMVIFEKTAASTAPPADPSQKPDDTAPRAARPTPVDTSMVNVGAEKNGTMTQARAEERTATLSMRPVHSSKALKPAPETKGYQTAQSPDTPLPSRDAPKPSHPAMLEKHPSQPVSLHQMDLQAEKQPSADVTGSIAAHPRKHHPAGKNQPAHNRSPILPSVEGLSEKRPATPASSAPARLALNLSQTASPADSPESGRQALGAGHSSQQPVVPALPPVGQVASQPSMAALSVSTTISPTVDDGAMLRLELPLWSAVGITEMPVNENQDIRPSPDLPPASREMRMLSDIIEKAYWHQDNGRAQARIQIKPAFLGHLHLNVLTDQARVSVEIRVETPMAREFIEMNLQTLKTDLQDSGLEIDRLDVVVDQDADDSREPFRESARKLNRRAGPSPEMVETAPPDHEAALPETGNAENSINTFA